MSTPALGKKKILVYIGLMLLVAGAAGPLYVLRYQKKKCGEKKTALQKLERQLGVVGAKLDKGEVENLEKELPSLEAIQAIDVCSADRVFQNKLIDQRGNIDRWKELIDLMERGDSELAKVKYQALCESHIQPIKLKGLNPDPPGPEDSSFAEKPCSLFSKGKIAPWLGPKYIQLLGQDLNKTFQAEQEQFLQLVSGVKELADGKGELHDEKWRPSRKGKILVWNLVTNTYYYYREAHTLYRVFKPDSVKYDYHVDEASINSLERLRASPTDPELTIFCVRKQKSTLTGMIKQTSYTKNADQGTLIPTATYFPYTREKTEIAVIDWPEKTLAGFILFDTGTPPKEFTGDWPDTPNLIEKYILSLPEEK